MDSSLLLPGAFGLFGLFWVFFVVVGLIVVAGFVTVITLIVVNMRRVAARGHNPLTLQSDLATGLLNSQALAPRQTRAARLEELDQLLAGGAITAEEHAAGRAHVLTT